ncbi:MAG: MoxR family ATPase [Kibdelosporangium sp.]
MTGIDRPPDSEPDWWIYRGTGQPDPELDLAAALPAPPGWRVFDGGPPVQRPGLDDREPARRLGPVATPFTEATSAEIDMVNAALYLRRPLLVTGRPGTGKSTLAYKIARELQLGPVLRWPINSRSKLIDGLWEYDAIGRVQAASGADGELDIGHFVHLGPLGTALLPHELPRVLLIDELDKSDIDLPNDLLNVFEDGEFEVRPLVRVASRQPDVRVFTDDRDTSVTVRHGRVRCRAFPVVVVTSNGEREFPPAFLRRCLRLEMTEPTVGQLAEMVASHFAGAGVPGTDDLIRSFVTRSRQEGGLAADQLLNSVYMATSGAYDQDPNWARLCDALWRKLGAANVE